MSRNQKHRKLDVPNPKIRVSGEKGSEQNTLRGELYANAFEHINRAYEQGFYIECIALLDSMITDRLESYCQYLSHEDDKQFSANSVFDAIRNLGSMTKEKGVRDDEYKIIHDKIEDWSAKRNSAIHSFVIVREYNLKDDTEKRMSKIKEVADMGLQLVREVMKYTRTRIDLK